MIVQSTGEGDYTVNFNYEELKLLAAQAHECREVSPAYIENLLDHVLSNFLDTLRGR